MNLKIVSFELSGEIYGINVNEIEEILRVPEIANVPNTSDFIEGVINLRGNIVTVLNLSKKFFLDEKDMDDNSRIIVIEEGEESVGVLVDSVSEVVRVNIDEIEEPPDISTGIPKDAFMGVLNFKGRMLILLDIKRVLSMEGE